MSYGGRGAGQEERLAQEEERRIRRKPSSGALTRTSARAWRKIRLTWMDSQLAPDDACLSYYDVRLTNEDINSLKNDWLTDDVIRFWEGYFERGFLTSYKNPESQLWHSRWPVRGTAIWRRSGPRSRPSKASPTPSYRLTTATAQKSRVGAIGCYSLCQPLMGWRSTTTRCRQAINSMPPTSAADCRS